MGRKVFLSFLGTNNYKECIYSSKEKGQSKVVKFVQTAVLDLYCSDFSRSDIAYIFLTEEAQKVNWESLKSEIGNRNFSIHPIDKLPEGYSENDIWNIFEQVYNLLNDKDEIVLDVTHGFRSLPMLGMVLLNYARALKNISVRTIAYGAFEALGPAYDIEKRIPNPSERKAPLLDLTAFSSIQQWSFGAETFVKTGNSEIISGLTSENIKPLLIESKGQDKTASVIRSLINSLKEIDKEITTNRGKKIDDGRSIKNAIDNLETLSESEGHVFTLLKPILKIIERKLNRFQNTDPWQASVEWCIEHGLIQQGITQLQEGIISYIASDSNLDKTNLIHREIVAQALNILAQEISEENWRTPASENKEEVKRILESKFVVEHNNNYQRLSVHRNDINHGGYKGNALVNGERFTQMLNEVYNQFKNIADLKK